MKKHHLTLSATKRILFFLLILISYILQFTVLPRTSFAVPVLLLIPVTTAISVHENEFAALLWGLISGILWDMASPLTDGLYALIFPVIFFLTGLLTHYILRRTFLTSALFCCAYSLIPSTLSLILAKEKLTADFFKAVILSETLPSAVLALLLLIPVYYLVNRIYSSFTSERS